MDPDCAMSAIISLIVEQKPWGQRADSCRVVSVEKWTDLPVRMETDDRRWPKTMGLVSIHGVGSGTRWRGFDVGVVIISKTSY